MREVGARRVLVAGIGNVFRCDDGFGPEVARRLAALPWPDGVRVVDYGIRGMHLAYDLLEPWDALVMVDALPDHGEGGRVVVLSIDDGHVGKDAHVDAHSMDPATVLGTLAALGGRLPPTTLLVGCQVTETGDGMGLTSGVEAAVDAAVRTVQSLVTRMLQPVEVL
jgi:hydrogenase maturation protease